MRIAWLVTIVLTLSACTAAGTYDSNLGERIAADVNCLAQLALDGLTVYSQTETKTANDVAATITSAASLTTQALAACGPTLQNVGYDLAAAKAKAKGTPSTK